MAKTFANIRPDAGGGGGAVDSVNGQTGVVVLDKSDIGLGNADNTSDLNKPISTATQAALDLKQDLISGSANRVARFNNSAEVTDISQWQIDDNGYLNANFVAEPDGLAGAFDVLRHNVNIEPLQNSPNEVWDIETNQVIVDPSSSGFDIGTSGQGLRYQINNATHSGTSNLGAIEYIHNNFNIGNGTDPIDVKGVGYIFGLGQFNANSNINGPMQGYGYQPSINAAATIDPTQYTQAFYDTANYGCASPNYISFNASPTIAEIINNTNYTAFQINPNITDFTGNASFNGVGISGNFGTFNGGSWQGININPIITEGRYVAGLNVSMNNVSLYAGTVGSLVIQDLTIESDLPSSFANTASIEYTTGGTAGSEIVSNTGFAFSVQIESGVSTATQVAAALNAYPAFILNFNVTISGTASDPQVTQAATNLAGGTDPGSKQAAYLDGDVQITGGLAFGGALSIGQLNAFATQALVDGGGNPTTIHSLISNPTVAANATIANADTLGINTAMLLTIGDNATVTTAFVGVAALALPAVISMGTGSTIDQVSGGTFAVSLDGGATGGVIDKLDICRSIAIPNGVTTITNLRGYKFDLPFGDPGTTTWGFYSEPDCHNYFAGNLKISGADTVTNSSIGLEIESTTKAMVLSRMTTTERNALTAINGMQIYNTSTDKFQGYAAGSWVDLH